MQHAYFQGEKKVLDYYVDGYAVVDGVKTVWEYNGCGWHGCACIKNPTEKQIKKQQQWMERKTKLETNGYKVIEMTCCRWRKIRKYIQRNPPKTELGRILCKDNQEILQFIHLKTMCF